MTHLSTATANSNPTKQLLTWTDKAWDDYLYWQEKDRKKLKRINSLIKDIKRSNFEGLGKPEPLKHALSGYWSRRINDKNRLTYKVTPEHIIIRSCRSHYRN